LRVPPLPGTVTGRARLPGALVTPDRGPVSGTGTTGRQSLRLRYARLLLACRGRNTLSA
jgi:hypothetical protein